MDLKALEKRILNTVGKNLVDNLQKQANKAYDKMNENVAYEFLDVVEDRLQDMYKSVITEFYSSYTPDIYHRDGNIKTQTGGLYNLLKIKNHNGELSWDFDPSSLLYRDGSGGGEGDLYDLIFRKGYHGGSTKDTKGIHPNTGVPYWRIPDPYYSHWGRPATKAPISPILNWNLKLYKYKKKQLRKDYDSIYDKHFEKFKKDWRNM